MPEQAHVIWCFPAESPETVAHLAENALPKSGRLVVLGSTSAYDLAENMQKDMIDESAALDLARPRVQGEEYLRLHRKAIILRVAGIYGPGRNVVDWIRHGKVGPSSRSVNLIHVEDLAALCLLALRHGRPEDTYNVSDGWPRLWKDICETAARRWGVAAVLKEDLSRSGKRISIEKLRERFQYTFRYPNLYDALERLESGSRDTGIGSMPPAAQ